MVSIALIFTGCSPSSTSPYNPTACAHAVMKKYNTINVIQAPGSNKFMFIVKDNSNRVLFVSCNSSATVEPTNEEVIFE